MSEEVILDPKDIVGAFSKLASEFAKDMSRLQKQMEVAETDVYVGIPEGNAERTHGEINNATLLYIHTQGSPMRGLPSRPVIEPALAKNANVIAESLAEISRLTLDNKLEQAKRKKELLGKRAVKMIRAWFDDPDNGWEPNKPSTVAAKLRKTRKSLKKRKAILEDYVGGVEGIDKILVDTAEMKKAITYVVGK
jgi:hypothetical protein